MSVRQLKIETEFNGILWSDIIYVDNARYIQQKPPSTFSLYRNKIFTNHKIRIFSDQCLWNIVNDTIIYEKLNKNIVHISFYIG